MDLKKKFGQNIKKYRKLQDLTQEQLAELVELDTTSISSIETGKFFPTADNIQKLAAALNIRIETLFFFEDDLSDDCIHDEIISIIESIRPNKSKIRILRNFLNLLVS